MHCISRNRYSLESLKTIVCIVLMQTLINICCYELFFSVLSVCAFVCTRKQLLVWFFSHPLFFSLPCFVEVGILLFSFLISIQVIDFIMTLHT